MTTSIMRRDGLMIVVPYLTSTFTLASPAFLLVNSGDDPLFDTYQQEFDYMIGRSKVRLVSLEKQT
jgi:hypothetical protein